MRQLYATAQKVEQATRAWHDASHTMRVIDNTHFLGTVPQSHETKPVAQCIASRCVCHPKLGTVYRLTACMTATCHLPAISDKGHEETAHGAADGVGEQQAVGLGGEGGVAHPVGRRRLRPVQQVLRAAAASCSARCNPKSWPCPRVKGPRCTASAAGPLRQRSA
jgi:hypothetical protein